MLSVTQLDFFKKFLDKLYKDPQYLHAVHLLALNNQAHQASITELLNNSSEVYRIINKINKFEDLADNEIETLQLIYNAAQELHRLASSELLVPDSVQQELVKDCHDIVQVFEEYRRGPKKLPNLSVPIEVKNDPLLFVLLSKAVFDTKNYQLTERQCKAIQEALGADWNRLLDRYNLQQNNLTLDELRMLLIGKLANLSYAKNDKFLSYLFYIFAIDQQHPEAKQQLQDKLSATIALYDKKHEAIERLGRQPPINLLPRAVNAARKWVGKTFGTKWQSVIPERFKVNDAFRNDLQVVTTTANANKWQRQKEPLNKYSSDEYLFRELAYMDLKDGSVVQVVEPNGKLAFYRVHNLSNDLGITGCALVPVDSRGSLDIKVLFRGTDSVASAIIDTEKYGTGHSSFNKCAPQINSKLNNILEGLQQQNPHKKLSLTIGGHSLGGALAQNLLHSITSLQASEHIDEKQISAAVKKQVTYEFTERGKDINNDKFKKEVERRTEDLLVHLQKRKEQYANIPYQCLASIKDINLVTLNSAGIAHKVRNRTLDSLQLLNKQSAKININSRSLMVGGDLIQQLGQNNISSYVSPEIIQAELFKANIGVEKAVPKRMLKVGAFLLVQGIVFATTGFVVPDVLNLLEGKNPLEKAKNVAFGAYNDLRKAHTKKFFDKGENPSYELYRNLDDSKVKLNKELTTKLRIAHSDTYQKVKKSCSKWLWKVADRLKEVYKKAKPKAYIISDVVEKKYAAVSNIVGAGNIDQVLQAAGIETIGNVPAFPEAAMPYQPTSMQTPNVTIAQIKEKVTSNKKWQITERGSAAADYDLQFIPWKSNNARDVVHVKNLEEQNSVKFSFKVKDPSELAVNKAVETAASVGKSITIYGSNALDVQRMIDAAKNCGITNIKFSPAASRAMQHKGGDRSPMLG